MTQDHEGNRTPAGSVESVSQTSCNALVANWSGISSISYKFCPDCVPGATPAAPANLVREVFLDLKAVSHQCAMQTETQRKPYVQWRASFL